MKKKHSWSDSYVPISSSRSASKYEDSATGSCVCVLKKERGWRVHVVDGVAFGGLPTFLGLPGGLPRLRRGRPRLRCGRALLLGGGPRFFARRLTMVRANSLVPSLTSAERDAILFLSTSAEASTSDIESEAFFLGIIHRNILVGLP